VKLEQLKDAAWLKEPCVLGVGDRPPRLLSSSISRRERHLPRTPPSRPTTPPGRGPGPCCACVAPRQPAGDITAPPPLLGRRRGRKGARTGAYGVRRGLLGPLERRTRQVPRVQRFQTAHRGEAREPLREPARGGPAPRLVRRRRLGRVHLPPGAGRPRAPRAGTAPPPFPARRCAGGLAYPPSPFRPPPSLRLPAPPPAPRRCSRRTARP